MSSRAVIGLSIVLVGTLLGACADGGPTNATDTPVTSAGAPNIAVIAAGVALPAGYKVDPDRTTIFGTDERWTGRLTYTTTTGADDVFDFLHKEMPSFGWVETTAMRSDISLLTFMSSGTGRMATVNIQRGGTLGNTRVDMVVAPQSGANTR